MKHYELEKIIQATPNEVFQFVNDHAQFSSHMNKPSLMMGGGRMITETDEGKGQKIGSHIRLKGKAFGIPLFLDEVVTRYEPPFCKTWETVGEVKLIVVGHYKMGIEIKPLEKNSFLRVFIDYDLPQKNAWLGKLFGKTFAKWCVNQMIRGASDHFKK